MTAQIDHIVVVAHSLVQGVAWCEATLGITPGPGGEHALFGTHNRLFKIATPKYPSTYFEIIAINTGAACALSTSSKRWFDMDNPVLQAAVVQQPRLVHFVASVPDANTACAVLQQQGIDRGPVLQASRPTPSGLLHWQITVRTDGQRLFDGALPTLIQWGKPGESHLQTVHPTQTMPDSGVTLESMHITHPDHTALHSAYQAIGLQGVNLQAGPPNIVANLRCPKGKVALHSLGI